MIYRSLRSVSIQQVPIDQLFLYSSSADHDFYRLIRDMNDLQVASLQLYNKFPSSTFLYSSSRCQDFYTQFLCRSKKVPTSSPDQHFYRLIRDMNDLQVASLRFYTIVPIVHHSIQ